MFGLRYHVVTVFSMLIMLGLGFLFGATSGFQPYFVKAQTKNLSKLNATLNNMLQDDDRDRALLRQNEDAISALTPGLVGGKLAHKRVALIQLGDYPSADQAASEAIGDAGGSVVSTMTIRNRLATLDDDKRRQLAGPGETLSSLYHCLAVAFRAGTNSRPDAQSGLDALQSNDMISYSGDYSQPVSGVIVVGGWSDDPTDASQDSGGSGTAGSADQPDSTPPDGPSSGTLTNSDNEVGLIEALLTGGSAPLTVVGCETSDATNSSVPDFTRAGIASVDCIDMPLGALDLPYLLQGERGAYGIKSQATHLVPTSVGGSGAQAQT